MRLSKFQNLSLMASSVPALLALLTLVILVFEMQPARAQVAQRDNFGKEFYVAYGPNLGGERDGQFTVNVMDLYITSHVAASGAVEVPALSFYQTFTTVPGQITTIHLPNGNNNTPTVELQDGDDERVISGMAVHVTSDSDIAVFGLNHRLFSSDAFMGLPVNTLGTEYRTMNYNSSSDGYSYDPLTPGEFWIIAVTDSAHVTITPAASTANGSPALIPINVTLQTGQIYMVQGQGDLGNDLTGSHIESDQPIAVFSGHKRTEMPVGAINTGGKPSRDHLVEQLPPVSAWGDSALVVPYATSTLPDLVRVVCAEDGTEITVNGKQVMNGPTNKFNAGDFYEITQLAGVTSIQASNPIMVGQYMHTSYGSLNAQPPPEAYGDPALALVYPVEQFQSSYTILSIIDANSFTGNFVNIVADPADVTAMTLDGTLISPSEFHQIPGSRFWYAQHPVQQGTHNMSAPAPFGVTIYGLGPVDSYSYTGGTLLKTITPLETVGLVIDFGDRVIGAADIQAPYPHNVNNSFDTMVVLKNVSNDIVNIFSFPKRIQDTDRFYVNRTVPSSGAPTAIAPPMTIAPLTIDSFQIEFWPHEINRRMHTQITAKTDHLRAYVVDVYGRGVQDNMGVYRDSNKVHTIDTIDFGTFAKTDVVSGDSEAYVGNAGTAKMNVSDVHITAPHPPMAQPYFTNSGITYLGNTITTPFQIAESPSHAARIGLSFNPNINMANGIYSDSLVISSTTSTHIVVLIAHIETITPLSPDTNKHVFGTTLVCDDSSFDIQISNTQNDIPITLTSANIIGTNATDFALSTKTPLIIPAGATKPVLVHFLPTGRGVKNAQVILKFNKPRNGTPDTVQLSGTGDKRVLELAGSVNVHAYASDDFLVPIFAVTDLTPFAPTGYQIVLNYDTVNLQLIDVVSNNTLTPPGFPAIFSSTPPGRDTVLFQQGSDAGGPASIPIIGGGCGTNILDTSGGFCQPLIYLKFRPVMNGEDPQTFHKSFPIGYTITFDNSLISSACVDRLFDSGYVQIASICDKQFLQPRGEIPSATMLEPPFPNPSSASISMQYDIGTQAKVKLDVEDVYGNTVAVLAEKDAKPGYYKATFDGSSLPSGQYFIRMVAGDYRTSRRVVIQK